MSKNYILLILIVILSFTSSQAQQAAQWSRVNESQVPLNAQNDRKIIPLKYEVWKVNFQALKRKLDLAPLELTESQNPVVISIPMPNGEVMEFDIKESPIADPELFHKYPTFKTFTAVGVRDRSFYGRIDYTIDGFRAAIDTPEGEVYVDPYATEMQNYCVVYYTADYVVPEKLRNFKCGVKEAYVPNRSGKKENVSTDRSVATAVTVRKYRLALGSTGEFAAMNGKSKEKVMAKMVALVNRVNKTTIQELAIRMELIANNDTLIWLDTAKDPFPNGDVGGEVLSKSHDVIAFLVGRNSFDIGHTITGNCTDVGGIAQPGVVCSQGRKGSGVSCDQSGNTDNLAVTIMCHEIGHQFSGSHTMSACNGSDPGQVGSSSRAEPGSGTSILSYDGGCGNDNVTGQYWKPNGHFCTNTKGQFFDFSRSGVGNECPQKTVISNRNPVVNILHQKKGLYIPIGTPFELNAKATDEDNDPIKYSWEQADEGAFISLGEQNVFSNSFRIFDPVNTGTRTFPRLDNILRGRLTKDELYPDTTRNYTFVIAAMDFNVNGGGIGLDTIKFKSTHKSGPFQVEFPNTTQDTVQMGDYVIVKWDVANTDGPLVNCQKVDILLSRDGGNKYPYLLLKNTENDGEEGVILPKDIESSVARIRINAVDNIFFDVSDKNFHIRNNNKVGYNLAANTERKTYCLPDPNASVATINIQSTSLGSYDKPIELSIFSGLPAGATAKFDKSNISPDESTKLFIDLSAVTQTGEYNIVVQAISGLDTILRTVKLVGASADFSATMPSSPFSGATSVNVLPIFTWSTSPSALTYDIEIASNPSFAASTILGSAYNLKSGQLESPVLLSENALYYWRIRAANGCRVGEWTIASPFHTSVQACSVYTNTDPIFITATQSSTVNSILEVTESGVISDVNVVGIKGNHSNFGQLQLRLFGPNGKFSYLSENKCIFSGGSKLLLRYDDEAPTINKCDKLLSVGVPYKPETALGVFDGTDAKGIWRLEIKDLATGDGGLVEEWGIRLCSARSVSAPTVVRNDTLRVRPTSGRFISDSLLYAIDDKATPIQLTYTLVTLPKFGKINRWGAANLELGATFTQQEINQKNAIRYINTDPNAKSDFFLFVLTDGEGGFVGTLRYNIEINANAPTSSVKDQDLDKVIFVYPNPAGELINIQMNDPSIQLSKVQLFDINGREVVNKNWPGTEYNTQIETGQLPAGMYLIKISKAGVYTTKRVMIAH
ncbi:MAG: reprolysin-like metallopeptidase [Saprospiraceae bacterium]